MEWRHTPKEANIRVLEPEVATPRRELLWVKSESIVPLEAGEVQVWQASADMSATAMAECRASLAADELERAERMRAGVARDEFVAGRSLLRRLVGSATGKDATSVRFGNGRHGKPVADGVEFNVSHSRGVILIALCRESAVGIDVEWMDGTIEALDIARQSFSAEEYGRVSLAAEGRPRVQAFYECWTRKEAVVKAHGDGLTMALQSFTVPPDEGGETAVEVAIAGLRNEIARYYVRNLEVSGNFLAALGFERKDFPLRCFKSRDTLCRNDGSR